MNAQDLEARSRLGAAYAQAGRVADAERTFRAVLDIDPESAEALDESRRPVSQDRAPRRGDRDAEASHRCRTGVAWRAQHAGRCLRAIRGSSRARSRSGVRSPRVRPDDPDILYNLGTALLQLNRPAEARPVLERFVATAPPRYAADVARVRQLIAQLPR